MNAQQFLTWMRNPGQTSREESAQLDALLDSFPYFQSGHLLYIKNLHNQGSFLYNNQLKTAAAYAVNRKVLYNLITLKTAPVEVAVAVAVSEQSVSSQSENSQQSAFDYVQSDKQTGDERPKTGEKKAEEQISVPPKFPPKKFTSNPDEWEAGMLRQLQLLHHWQQTGEQSAVKQSDSQQSSGQQSSSQQSSSQQSSSQQSNGDEIKAEVPVEAAEQKVPDAKEEINTLLYVLVEPGQSEDLAEEAAEEISGDVVTEESETTQWEIKIAEEEKPETETPVVVQGDAVQQDILVEAIHSTFELEVDDKIPSVEEMKPFRLEPIEQTAAPVAEEKPAEEVVVTGMEMSFSQWVQEVSKSQVGKSEVGKSEVIKKEPGELPKTPLTGDKLIEQFIKDEPRLNVKKSGFYNPVNMAKKSVQESDEFITETLARIYAKQGNTVKAIRAYQKLSLKFPEKTAYFAALIEELKRTPNK